MNDIVHFITQVNFIARDFFSDIDNIVNLKVKDDNIRYIVKELFKLKRPCHFCH